uniref:Calcium homeostasis regulator CHoR1 n=1 Tax=Medicago truncatula TaxID=3880 RepID=I3SJJ3_MEDTR|nr:unknown [Medicago truncatula]
MVLSNLTSSSSSSSSSPYSQFFNLSSFSKLTSPSSSSLLFHSHHHVHHQTKQQTSKPTTNFTIKAYMENPNSFSNVVSKVIGALPVVGLLARIMSDEGGVGNDLIDFAEFRRRVGKNCTATDSTAFYQFQARRGRAGDQAGDPIFVLLCCWLVAIGAGLLKTEEILEGVGRLRVSNDIEFEERTFIAMMDEARERRARQKGAPPAVPMEVRVEKALDAIYVCCFGKDPIEAEDERLLSTILSSVFPSVQKQEIRRMVKEMAEKVEDGGMDYIPDAAKPLSKEAVEMQMKDLNFLKQNSNT